MVLKKAAELASGFGNPLGSTQGWCRDLRPYQDSIINGQDYVGHDSFASRRSNRVIDDIKLTGCSE
jgi:hypothetical protein